MNTIPLASVNCKSEEYNNLKNAPERSLISEIQEEILIGQKN